MDYPHSLPGRPLLLLTIAVLGMGAAGCGSRKTYPVEGVVVFEDDVPAVALAGGTVQFEGVDVPVSAEGGIGPNGTFRLTTGKPGDGAAAGNYRVAVVPPNATDIDRRRKPLLDPAFQQANTSGIEVTVEPRSNHFTIKVRRSRR